MKKTILFSVFLVFSAISIGHTFEPRMRSVWFHDSSKDYKTLSIMGCTAGYYQIKGRDGTVLADFMQPCASLGMKTDGTEGVRVTLGIGVVEVMNMLSFNIGMLPDGNMMYGTGISLKFDDSAALFGE